MRKFFTVVAPWLVWGLLDSVIYVLLSAVAPALFPSMGPDMPTYAIGAVLIMLLMRVLYSVAAGWCAGKIGRQDTTAIRIAVALLFVTGVAVQVISWSYFPIWYHILFLATIIPAANLGVRMARAG